MQVGPEVYLWPPAYCRQSSHPDSQVVLDLQLAARAFAGTVLELAAAPPPLPRYACMLPLSRLPSHQPPRCRHRR